jgi:hypothetical protein
VAALVVEVREALQATQETAEAQAVVLVLAVLQQQQVVLEHQDKATAAQMSKAAVQAVVVVVLVRLQHHQPKAQAVLAITQVRQSNTQEVEAVQV